MSEVQPMLLRRFCTLLAVAALTVAVSPLARADGDRSPRRTPRIDESKRIVRLTTDLKASLEDAGKLDIATRAKFDEIIAAMQKIAVPISSDVLTDEEREILTAQLSKPAANDASQWYARLKARLLEQAFEDTDLSDEEQQAASKIISTWYDASNRAYADRDSKLAGELKSQRDDDLRALLGRRKAGKVLSNLRESANGWGR